MKLRWREHERLLVTLLTLLTLVGYCWNMFHFSYRDVRPAFGYYLHDFLPKAMPVLLVFFCYLWAEIRLVPKLQFRKEDMPPASSFLGRIGSVMKMYPWQVVQAILLFFLLGVGLTIESHRSERLFFIFRRFPFRYRGFYAAFLLSVIYKVYVILREMVIDHIDHSGERRSYLVMVANRVTGFVVWSAIVMELLDLFDFIHDWKLMMTLYSLVICSFFMGMGNIYWLFPKYGKERFFNVPLLSRLFLLTLVSALLIAIPFSLHNGRAPAPFMAMWLFGLLIITPVSWIIYQYRKDQILRMRGMEKELIQSQSNLAFLRSQINPHFLFNVLNTLYGTALQEQAERTAEGIQKLGDMMRFMLHENNLEQIRMRREIEYLENYISLQKLRTATSAGIVIEDDICGDHCDHMIAPMLLIPFVENAFKHGISLQEKSWIKITLRCDATHIYFETRNSIHARPAGDPDKSASGIGLNNVRERLRLQYPGRYDLEVNGSTHEFLVKLVIRVTGT